MQHEGDRRKRTKKGVARDKQIEDCRTKHVTVKRISYLEAVRDIMHRCNDVTLGKHRNNVTDIDVATQIQRRHNAIRWEIVKEGIPHY